MAFSARLSSFRPCLRKSNPSSVSSLSPAGPPPGIDSTAARLDAAAAGLRRIVLRCRISNRKYASREPRMTAFFNTKASGMYRLVVVSRLEPSGSAAT